MGEGVWGLILLTKLQESEDIILAAADPMETRPRLFSVHSWVTGGERL